MRLAALGRTSQSSKVNDMRDLSHREMKSAAGMRRNHDGIGGHYVEWLSSSREGSACGTAGGK